MTGVQTCALPILNSLGFKKYEGIKDNSIYGFDFNNKINDSDRIIACFMKDYVKKNEFDFDRYKGNKNDKKGIILFSIAKHNDQEKEALKVSKRINSHFFDNGNFKNLNRKKEMTYKDMLEIRDNVKRNQETNMTFRADRKSTRLNSSHPLSSRMPSSA